MLHSSASPVSDDRDYIPLDTSDAMPCMPQPTGRSICILMELSGQVGAVTSSEAVYVQCINILLTYVMRKISL